MSFGYRSQSHQASSVGKDWARDYRGNTPSTQKCKYRDSRDAIRSRNETLQSPQRDATKIWYDNRQMGGRIINSKRRYIAFSLGFLLLLSGCVSLVKPGPRQVQVPLSVAKRALDTALAQVGDPYVWGGQGPDEFDCSGLIIWSYAKVYPGLQLKRSETVIADDATQDELWRYNVLPLTPEQMQPGDIVFITNDSERMTHGGLFIAWVNEARTEFRFVNASSYYGEVVIDTWPVEGEKRGQWFAGAGRLLVTVN